MDSEGKVAGGAAFLCGPVAPGGVRTPEDLPGDVRQMADTMTRFVRQEVLPREGDLERHEPGVMRALLRRAGELGLLGGAIPERYGGLGLPRSALALLYERAAESPSFALTHNVHGGVSTLPLVWFGSEEQRAAHLPGMAAGAAIGAFALTEANAGSDALSLRCRAERTSEGWRLTGVKQWITNAGFADLFTVFARADEGLTAFLVPRELPGVSLGREEEKMGLRGTSTRTLFLDGVRLPPDAVLGDVGGGHRVALYPLNLGRFNIGAGALGASKTNLYRAARYARERRQFGQSLAAFGLVRHKLGEMAARVYALESALYRAAGLIDGRFAGVAEGDRAGLLAAAEEFAVECALVKVFGTETLGYVVDESLQIHGGYGYSEAYPAARAYRDARVARIFEGTNEINRLTIADQIGRRVRKGRLTFASPEPRLAGPGGEVEALREAMRAAFLLTWEHWQHDGSADPADADQESAALLADLTTALFVAESAELRAARLTGHARDLARDAAMLAIADACARSRALLHALCAHLGDRRAWARLSPHLPEPWFDAVGARRRLAEAAVEGEMTPAG
jgi:alkylation response protein AidB-like acyl-CoA dehydrogenase